MGTTAADHQASRWVIPGRCRSRFDLLTAGPTSIIRRMASSAYMQGYVWPLDYLLS